MSALSRDFHSARLTGPDSPRRPIVGALRIVILGGAGMLGRKLAERLILDGTLGSSAIARLALVDVVPPTPPHGAGFVIDTVVADISEPGVAESLVSTRPDVVFHLAAVLSGEAEADFEQGYRVNLDGTRHLLETIRTTGSDYVPGGVRVVDRGVRRPVSRGDRRRPRHHAADELRHTEGHRRAAPGGLFAARVSRRHRDPVADALRPSRRAQPAASGFFSSIIREPLNGREAILPVPESVRHWFASPRAAVGFLVRAAALDTGVLGDRRCLTMPGLSATVAEQIAALRKVAGDEAVRLIRREPDETIMRIVAGWPRNFDPRRAQELGFTAEASFDEIVRIYIDEELSHVGGSLPGPTAASG